MITGYNKSCVEKILRSLEDSPFNFYLTGSRFFGFPSQNSDYDFFVQDDEFVRNFLENEGFKKKSFCTRSQNYAIALQNNRIVEIWENGLVQIQIVKNFEHKVMLHEKLLEAKISGFPKEARKQIWELAYTFFPEPSEPQNVDDLQAV